MSLNAVLPLALDPSVAVVPLTGASFWAVPAGAKPGSYVGAALFA